MSNGTGKPGSAAPEKRVKTKADGFWSAFLFVKNGKPKSSLLIYTFCLSFVFLAVYALAFTGAIEFGTSMLSALPAFWSNLILSVLASVVSVAVCSATHCFFKDKRLVFGAHLWMSLYAVAILITMLIMLGGEGGIDAFLAMFCWFGLIPVAIGVTVTAFLYSRDYRPKAPKDDEPEWKKYVTRRSE